MQPSSSRFQSWGSRRLNRYTNPKGRNDVTYSYLFLQCPGRGEEDSEVKDPKYRLLSRSHNRIHRTVVGLVTKVVVKQKVTESFTLVKHVQCLCRVARGVKYWKEKFEFYILFFISEQIVGFLFIQKNNTYSCFSTDFYGED